MNRIMAFHLPQWRTPWMAAFLLLAFIWSIFLLRMPEGTSQPQSLPLPATGTGDAKDSELKIPDEQSAVLPSDRPLILYAYSETVNARANFEFFLAHGLHGAADFVFILNGESDAGWLIPNATNIHIVQRENDCYDLGAYAEVLTKDLLYKNYKRFIMINASVRGPFLPHWAQSCWSDMYLNRVSDKVKLVGMTGNCWPKFHVQSMIWATDITGVELLLFPPKTTKITPLFPDETPRPEVGINDCFHDWDSAVHAEIHASQIILDAGYELDVMMSAFHVGEYIEHCDNKTNGDVLWQGKYEGTNVHPYETIFLKTNRDIDPVLMERLTSWHTRSNYSSYDYCKI